VAPFYVSVTGGSRARVVVPRHHAVPRLGFVAPGALLGDALREHSRAASLVELTRRFTATIYDGALLLADLAAMHGVAASPTAVTRTLVNYERHLSFYCGDAPPSSRLRSHTVSPYAVGDRVFVHLHGSEQDEPTWWPASIRATHADSTCTVSLDVLEDEEDAVVRVPQADVRPDVAFVSTRAVLAASDAEDDKDETMAVFAELMAALGQKVATQHEPASRHRPTHTHQPPLFTGFSRSVRWTR
jgi:hypothetical protein